ncbi:uncharacterized protein F5Z01DRAFT_121278 [Emericellopsis atlantica]|uniref:Uncharacterized protein n=1 Tax=Emericellopsis atlantica TaxID=2614577 RepID=A0A9P7ZM34_9HYPO|nr:uncharacterized protein F5Z01DRAFT_121278 [Emericellopsis atlantica]KAG9254212.1 hypothetical protein F5Z01DRAFT_121278 [Emericellopsis atlantica]
MVCPVFKLLGCSFQRAKSMNRIFVLVSSSQITDHSSLDYVEPPHTDVDGHIPGVVLSSLLQTSVYIYRHSRGYRRLRVAFKLYVYCLVHMDHHFIRVIVLVRKLMHSSTCTPSRLSLVVCYQPRSCKTNMLCKEVSLPLKYWLEDAKPSLYGQSLGNMSCGTETSWKIRKNKPHVQDQTLKVINCDALQVAARTECKWQPLHKAGGFSFAASSPKSSTRCRSGLLKLIESHTM